ncbi:MAG: EAL domain-containing protein, partial [Clostridia bacterium]|nr:EAL domain-containing protein [Clostridia bacterium]
SPLNLLRDYPIDRIKIDRSFLNQNSDTEEGMSILRYLISMAKEVGLTVITEGVETLEQTNLLGEIGSDIAQGYFFSKPVDLREFDQLNHSMVQRVYQSNEYYPTFEDLEKDLDLIAFMLEQT